MENWQKHSLRYSQRVSNLSTPLEKLNRSLETIPIAPLEFELSERSLVHYQICLAIIGGFRSVKELCISVETLWDSGQFLAASLSVRLLTELWGSSEFIRREVLGKLEQTGDIQSAQRKVSRLLLNSKSGVPLPWGGDSELKPIHVMDMVRQADFAMSGVLVDYEFLCDACHPSQLQHNYLYFAGANGDNWTNPKFAVYGHQMLDRTLTLAENSVLGFSEAGVETLAASIPIVLANRD